VKGLKIKVAIVVVVLFACAFANAQGDRKTFALEANKPIGQEITADDVHSYQIKTAAGQYLKVVVDQRSVDVVVSLFAPNGKKLVEVDCPNFPQGPEQLSHIATESGIHRIEITMRDRGADAGRYEIKLEELRASNPSDKNRINAERAFIEGEKLKGTEAVAKYEEALKFRNGLNDRYDEATILYSLGKTHNALGNKEKSLDYFRKSLTLFQNAGSWDETFKDLTMLYLVMGGKQKTFDYLADAIPLVRALRNQRLEAILLTGIAKVCEDMNSEQQALDYYQQSLSLFRITGRRGAEVFSLTEIHDSDLSLEDKKKALGYLQQALLLSRDASDKGLEVALLMGISYLHNLMGELQKALDYLQQALPIWRSLGDKNGEAYTFNFISSIYFSLGEAELARDNYEQALTLFRAVKDLRAEARTLVALGNTSAYFGETEKALVYFQNALKIFKDAGDKEGEASTLDSLGNVFWILGDKEKSLANYKQALALWRKIFFREGEAATLSNIGFVYDSIGDKAQAREFYNQSLFLFRLLGNPAGEAIALYGVARLERSRGNTDEALKQIENAIAIIESLRTKVASEDLRASYLASYQHFYQFYVDLLMQIHQSQPTKGFDALALQTSERARARSLLDILNEARADIRQGVDNTLLERERILQKQINAKDNARTRARTPQQSEALDKELRALTIHYEELKAEIKTKSPRYAALTQPQPVNLKEIQQMLDADTLLLEYSLGDERSYLWLVSQNSIRSFTLPKRTEIETTARNFYEAVKKESESTKAENLATELSRILIEPAASELKDKRLLIVADGVLQYVPFAALSVVSGQSSVAKTNSADNGQRTTDNGQPLIINHEIVYLPSASTLAALRREANERKVPTKTLAVLADPVFSADDPRVKRNQTAIDDKSALRKSSRDAMTADLNARAPLPRLPGTREEALGILALVPESERNLAMGFQASRATATSPELAQYRIIHFATHGILDSEHPNLSGVMLSLVDEKGKPQDGFLRLHEIFNLKLPADLIVLSACQTALGKEIRGEGLVGLTRGFMYAGASRVTASLWAVDDKATSELMKLFYQNMLGEKKLRPATALREAQITMWKTKRWNAPFYWSAFTIQGEWR
jgi:CHAT domain-containing protein/tetratricopeptide (TPR) repeat protein